MADEEDKEVERPQEETPNQNPAQGALAVGGIEIYNAAQLPYAGILVSGAILLSSLIAGDGLEDHKYYEYGIALSVIAMFFSLVGYICVKMGQVDAKFFTYNSYFLCVWNFVGACFLTFEGPFTITGNGYFAAWGLVIFAVMGLGVDKALEGVGSLMGLLSASIITVTAISTEGFDSQKSESVYGLIIALLTVLVVIYLFKSEHTNLNFPVLAVLAINWIVAASLLTFRGPFVDTGNGYFGAWGGAVTSVFAAVAARQAGASS